MNVATGSRPATVGAALDCTDEDTDAEAYAPRTDDVGKVTDGNDPVSVVPDYPIESPSCDGLATLAIPVSLDTDIYTPKKRDPIDRSLELRPALGEPIAFAEHIVSRAKRPPSEVAGFDDLRADEREGAYRTFRKRVLTELEANGCVVIDDKRRRTG
ncbi:MAG: hypothetical protein ABEH58_09865 [Haloplanus sp.]